MKNRKPRYLWLAVDLDDNETIIAVAETRSELAEMMGTCDAVITRKLKRKSPYEYRVEKIPFGDEEEGD